MKACRQEDQLKQRGSVSTAGHAFSGPGVNPPARKGARFREIDK